MTYPLSLNGDGGNTNCTITLYGLMLSQYNPFGVVGDDSIAFLVDLECS